MQQVNLYLDEFKKKRIPFSAETFAFVVFGSLMFCTLASTFAYVFYVYSAEQLRDANARLLKMQTAQELARREFQVIELDPSLQSRIGAMQQRVSQNRQLLKYLGKRNIQQHNQSFAGMLTALTEVQQSGLWLQEVRFDTEVGGLTLNGFALQPEAVPAYLKKLGKHTTFAGMQFKVFDLKRDKDKLAFTLSSKRKDNESSKHYMEVLGETLQPTLVK